MKSPRVPGSAANLLFSLFPHDRGPSEPFRMIALGDLREYRDGNGKLSKMEFTTWLELQEQIAKGHVMVSVLNHGARMFEILDADHDGSLSVREHRAGWERVKEAGCVTEKGFDRTKLPRQLQLLAAISRGLAVELEVNNLGMMSRSTVARLTLPASHTTNTCECHRG